MKVSAGLRQWLMTESRPDPYGNERKLREATLQHVLDLDPDHIEATMASNLVQMDKTTLKTLGGPNSGNHGHAGRPGAVGGSAPRGTDYGTQAKLPLSSKPSIGARTVYQTIEPKQIFVNTPKVDPSVNEVLNADAPDPMPDGSRGDSLQRRIVFDGDSNPIGGGHANEALKVEDPEKGDFVFKPVDGEDFDIREGTISNNRAPLAEREVLTSRVDKEMGLDLVPETVFGEYDGRVGSFQRFEAGDVGRDGRARQAEMGVLDAVIGNLDRHGGNSMESEDGELIAIDHGYTFGKTLPIPAGGGPDDDAYQGDSAYLRSWALGNLTSASIPVARQKELATRLENFDYKRVLHGSHLDTDEVEALHARVDQVALRLSKGEAHLLNEDFNVDTW